MAPVMSAGWKAETLTARQVVAHRDLFLHFTCEGCRFAVQLDPWRIGSRLADDPLRDLRFRCRRCGVYPSTLRIGRRTSGASDEVMVIPLKPRAWDDGHQEDQRRCLARAQAAREAARRAWKP